MSQGMETSKASAPQAVVIGTSAGGSEVLMTLFAGLPGDFPLPIIVVQHVHPHQDDSFAAWYGRSTALGVTAAQDKERVQPGTVYFAPPDYHLLVERDGSLALSVDERVNWSRPSIDVMFESAAYAWCAGVVGVILTGANGDGAMGLRRIRDLGGLTLAQDPATAEHPTMPQAAIDAGAVAELLSVEGILQRLLAIARTSS